MLFGWCRIPDDVGDARIYLVGAAAILDEYPPQVQQMICDPRTGTRLLKPFPSLHDLRAACERANEPFERQDARNEHHKALPPPRRAPRTPEDQARIDALVSSARAAHGLPPEGRARPG